MKPLRDLDVPRADAATGIVRTVMEDDLRDLPQREAMTVASSDDVPGVLRRMKEAQVGCALVLDGERFVGIFTERDAVRALIEGDTKAVADVMTDDVMALGETDSVAHALSQMAIGNSRFVPVAHADGRYTVVSTADVLEYIANEDW